MEVNRTIQWNLGTFNVPTLISVLGLIWYTATYSERQDARVNALETGNDNQNKTLEALGTKTVALDNVTYRVTLVEQGIADVNRRTDRQNDSIQSLRDDIAKMTTSFSVLSQKLDNVLPMKKTELAEPPKEIH